MVFTEDGGSFSTDITDCKLVLRPLSSISPNESTECANMMFEDSRADGEWLMSKAVHGEFNDIWIYFDRCASAIDYLRSINICVPFMGLDPIAEGWAILEEKISTNRVIAISCTNRKCHSTGQVSSEDCEIPKSAVSATETCPIHKKDGDIGSDLKFFDPAGNIVY